MWKALREGARMIGIEFIPGVWFYVDPKKVEIPQDGARMISMLEDLAARNLAGWIQHNGERAIKDLKAAYVEYSMDTLKRFRAFHHDTTITLTCNSIKNRLAAVKSNIHDPGDVIGEWVADGNGEVIE